MTGERIGDKYFTQLYALRNEDAKIQRNSGVATAENPKALKPQQSNSGCESVSNDMRKSRSKEDMCEPITNA